MNFLQFQVPNIEVPADSTAMHNISNRFHELVNMSWHDLSRTLITDAIKIGGKLIIAIVVFFVGKWMIKKFDALLNKIFERHNVEKSLNSFIRSMLRVIEWIFLIMVIVSILGIKTTSFLAILASFGFALGMALSGTLQNFAGGVLILLLKPFKIGDYIIAQGQEGTVTEINIFNTVLVTTDNKTITIPNGTMSNNIINNVSVKGTRRVEWVFGISYGDNFDEAKRIVRQVLREDSRIMTDPEPFIALNKMADSAVEVLARAWTVTSEYWNVFFDINEKVYKAFNNNGITIPFNQLDVHIQSPESTNM